MCNLSRRGPLYIPMKETQEILIKMGFENLNNNVWKSSWFGVFVLASTATPEDLARFIYNRGFISQVSLKLSKPSAA